jgi:hypothetical protein
MLFVPAGSLWCVVDKNTGDPLDLLYAARMNDSIGLYAHINIPDQSVVCAIGACGLMKENDPVALLFNGKIVWVYADSFSEEQFIRSASHLKRIM